MKGITLIGMPGSGKSTIGRLLAERLSFSFVDLDLFIKEKEGKSHADIAREKGDAELIQLEAQYALGLDLADTVFSPGGSIIYSPPAMEKLRRETVVIYLELPLAEIKRRLGKNINARGIVRLKSKGLEALFAERTPLYQSFTHHTIHCMNLNDAILVNKIVNLLL